MIQILKLDEWGKSSVDLASVNSNMLIGVKDANDNITYCIFDQLSGLYEAWAAGRLYGISDDDTLLMFYLKGKKVCECVDTFGSLMTSIDDWYKTQMTSNDS